MVKKLSVVSNQLAALKLQRQTQKVPGFPAILWRRLEADAADLLTADG
jgi:hypothetical protein